MYCLYGARIDAFVVTVRSGIAGYHTERMDNCHASVGFQCGYSSACTCTFSLILFLMCDFLGVCRPQLTFFIVVHVNLHANSAK